MNLLTEFSAYLQSLDRSPATVRGYLTDLSVFSRWLESQGTNTLETLIAANIRFYRQHLLEHSASPQTINRKLAAIAAFGNWAAQTGLLPANPALNIKSVGTVPQAPKWLDKKQRMNLLQAAKDDLQKARLRYPRLWVLRLRDAVVVTLLLNTGLRVSELANLKIGDLLLTERKSTLTVRAGKGTKQRVLPINRDARQILEQWLAVRPQIPDDALFVGQRGEKLQVRSVQCAVSRLAELAGLQDVTPHTCRHSFAKALIDSGVTLEKVATLLGHESLDTTRLYVTPGERDLEQAVGMLVEN
jgi:integrase/recombinase XerC